MPVAVEYIGKVYKCTCGNFLAPEQQWDYGTSIDNEGARKFPQVHL